MLPKVSIMMLCHTGRGKLLVRAVQSILGQTYPNWELVIQDDCSTDFTFDIAKLLAQKDKRIKVYQNQTNLGTPKNRAEAVKNMTGDLLCHVDSDDFIYPHALTTMVTAFIKNPALGFAYSDMAYGDETGKVTSYKLNDEPVQDQPCQGWRSLGMYTRKAYDQTNGYNTKLAYTCEDGDLATQIAEKFPIARVGHVLYWANNAVGADHVTVTHKIDCKTCPCRPDCNYARGYAKFVGYNLDTWEPIKITEDEQEGYTCKSKGIFNYKNYSMQQNNRLFDYLPEFFQEHQFDHVVEIGTSGGGFALYLHELSNTYNFTFRTYDVENRLHETPPFDFRHKSAWDGEGYNEIIDTLNLPGKVLLVVDGGDKPKEINLYSSHLKTNDVVMCHDYAPTKQYHEEHLDTTPYRWNWLEIEDKDIDRTNLEAINTNLIDVAWGVFRKT